MRFSGLPVSFFWFGLTVVIVGLQLFPLTGIFLMMLAAPLWSVVTINLGFISLALEALSGRVRFAWIFLPVLWFGGYFAAAFLSHQQAEVLARKFESANAAVKIAFDQQNQVLVFSGRSAPLSGMAAQLVRNYGVDVTYDERLSSKSTAYVAHRLAGVALCTEMRRDRSYRDANVFVTFLREDRKPVKGICAYTAPEDPVLPALSVSGTTKKIAHTLVPYTLSSITLRDPEGHTHTLFAGRAQALKWFPMPAAGCALNSAAPKWQCDAGFLRTNISLGGPGIFGASATPIVAKALGLEAVSAKEKAAALNAQVSSSAQSTAGEAPSPGHTNMEAVGARPAKVVADKVQTALQTLDAVISNPLVTASVLDLRILEARPGEIEQRLDGIVSAINIRMDGNLSEAWGTARALQGLLVTLPPATFQTAASRILPHIGLPNKWRQQRVSVEIVARLGNLGPEAVEALSVLAFEQPDRTMRAAALYGLCRTGPAAAGLADRIADILASAKPTDLQHEAAFVTLLRLGRKDLAEAGHDMTSKYQAKYYRDWLATVTPDSPAQICSGARGWPKLPAGI